jgi:CheY-like chemotaxis protein
VVLVVEDDPLIRWSVKETLSKDYRVRVAESAEEALKKIRDARRLDALLADVRLPGLSGLDLSNRLRQTRPGLKIFIMTAYSGEEAAREAFAIRADGYLTKPFAMETLKDMLLSHLGSTAH